MGLGDTCLVRMAEQYPDPCVFTLDGDFFLYPRRGRRAIPLIISGTALICVATMDLSVTAGHAADVVRSGTACL